MNVAIQPEAPNAQRLVPWLVCMAGLCAMYVPSLYDLFRTVWATEQQGHGPIVLGVAIWLIYREWPVLLEGKGMEPCPVLAWPLLVIGALLYVAGRSQSILLFEVGSSIWIVTGIIMLLRGPDAVKRIWFALFFMFFMIPLPGIFVDALTQPMKMAVSYAAEWVLFQLGYPVARLGVILQIGQYQLLVADACAGLQTLFALESLGLLYLNLVRHSSLLRNVILAILIVPISFTANVIRVITLTLITYYFGDEAGQGFLHGFAGMVLFVSALLLIIGADTLLRWWTGTRKARALPTEASS